MKLALAFLAGCALVAVGYFALADETPADDSASPLAPSIDVATSQSGMDLQPVAPRRERADDQAEPLALTPTDQDAPERAQGGAGLVSEEQLAELVAQRVEQVLDERERAERQEREEREEQFIKDRAHAIAEEVGLGLADELTLTDLMLDANAKRDELRDQMRNGAMPFDERMSMRDKFGELEAAYNEQLELNFGQSLSEQILGASSNGWRGAFGGGRRGGPPGGGRGPGGDN